MAETFAAIVLHLYVTGIHQSAGANGALMQQLATRNQADNIHPMMIVQTGTATGAAPCVGKRQAGPTAIENIVWQYMAEKTPDQQQYPLADTGKTTDGNGVFIQNVHSNLLYGRQHSSPPRTIVPAPPRRRC